MYWFLFVQIASKVQFYLAQSDENIITNQTDKLKAISEGGYPFSSESSDKEISDTVLTNNWCKDKGRKGERSPVLILKGIWGENENNL